MHRAVCLASQFWKGSYFDMRPATVCNSQNHSMDLDKAICQMYVCHQNGQTQQYVKCTFVIRMGRYSNMSNVHLSSEWADTAICQMYVCHQHGQTQQYVKCTFVISTGRHSNMSNVCLSSTQVDTAICQIYVCHQHRQTPC